MRPLVVLAAALTTAIACTSFSEAEPRAGAAEGGAADGGEAGSGGACPGIHGATMVRAGDYCIDSTEATRAQYREFVTAKNGDASGQIAACAGNASFEPSEAWPVPPGSDRKPVTHIDWCDAYAYCQWAGKRLCGRIGGGPTEATESALRRADRDQWYAACSHAGTREHSYGEVYEPGRCNGASADGGPGVLEEVQSFPRCEGGYDGLFDMTGNVEEWEDACQTDQPNAECYARDTAFYEPDDVSCKGYRSHPRLGFYFHIGIRCCGP